MTGPGPKAVVPRLQWSGETDPGVIWPAAPGPGQVWGLFAPAHHFDRQEFDQALIRLKTWGLKVSVPANIFRRARHLAGSDECRLEVMEELMADPAVGGLWAVRGGSGCQRLLPNLASRWAAWPPKPILGFSDLTALHLARLRAAGVIGWHGPMVAALGRAGARLEGASLAALKAALFSQARAGGWGFSPRDVLRPGLARGPLLGGNLCVLIHLLESSWLPEAAGAILLVEEVDEAPFRLDRLLTTLRQSRLWGVLGGLVFGRFTRCGSPAAVRALLRETAEAFPGPVLMNAPFGHGRFNRAFPLGALAELSA
ncbi:MAG: LD-carboxypeptidase [Candidatus Adiutrix sp.]|jgi:muramoyltetrapeptide carboxypeptidase|nr:LD-carboxypeptidase [Candidatus Adiutrix sp.]